MKLMKLSARNFKGLNFDLDLGAINFLIGSNFAGKTARTDAIRLLLLGHLPEQGKTNAATFMLASGRVLEVWGTFDDGTEIRRQWTAKGDSVKCEETVPDSFKENADLVSFMVDAETYFGKTDRERIEYVARNVKLGGDWSPDSIVAKMVDLLDRENEGLLKIADLLRHALDQAESPQEFVEAAIAAVDDFGKGAKQHAAKMEKTAQGLAYLRANDQPAVDLAALDRQRDDLVREVNALMEEKARHSAAYEQARAGRRRREELTQTVSAKSRFVSRRDELKAKIATAKAAAGDIPVVSEDQLDRLRMEESDCRASVRDHERDLNQVLESIGINEASLMAIDIEDKCPYCGASGEGWKTLKRAEIESALAGLRTKKDQLESHVENLRVQAESRMRAALEARNAQTEARARESTLRNLERDLDAVEKQLAVIESKEQELAQIPAEDPNVTAAVENAQTALNVKNEEIARIERDRKAAMGRASELQRLAQAERDRDGAKAEEEAAKKIVAALREVQAQMVAEAFKPLLAEANRLFNGALPFDLEYNPNRAEIGRWRTGTWVSHKTFSGVEKLLTYAAIQMALAARSPVRIMLLDEMLRAQNTEKRPAFDLLVDACKQAVREHGIDQFVGIIPGEAADYAHLAGASNAETDCKVISID